MSITAFLEAQTQRHERILRIRAKALCDYDGIFFIFKAKHFKAFKNALSLQASPIEYPLVSLHESKAADSRISFAFRRGFVTKGLKPEFYIGHYSELGVLRPAPILIQRTTKYFTALMPLANELTLGAEETPGA